MTLSGTVSNLLVKQRAGELTKTVAGVKEVVNSIEVAVPSREDWEIQSDVLTAFRTNEVLRSIEWQAPVQDGFVLLSGAVDSQHKKELAERLAKAIPGVRGVENQLAVALGTTRSDREILADVVSQLNWNPWLQNPQLVVRVTNGRVNLSGFVENDQARRQAVRAAWVTGTSGVDAQDLRVADSMHAAFLPPDAEETAPVAPPAEADDLQIQVGTKDGSRATNAPEAVGAPNAEPDRAGEGRVAGPGSSQGTMLRNDPGTLTRLEEVIQTDNSAGLVGRPVNFMSARVHEVIGDRVLLLGLPGANNLLPVRLQQPVSGIRPGQQIRISGVLAQMPQYLRWWDLNEQQEKRILKSPVYLNAMAAPGQGSAPKPGEGGSTATPEVQAPASSRQPGPEQRLR